MTGIFSGGTLNSLLKYWSSASSGYDTDTELIWMNHPMMWWTGGCFDQLFVS